jgi:hypothetical protein
VNLRFTHARSLLRIATLTLSTVIVLIVAGCAPRIQPTDQPVVVATPAPSGGPNPPPKPTTLPSLTNGV